MNDRRVRIIIDAQNKAKAALAEAGADLKKLAADARANLASMRAEAAKTQAAYLSLQASLKAAGAATTGSFSRTLKADAANAKQALQDARVNVSQAQAAYASAMAAMAGHSANLAQAMVQAYTAAGGGLSGIATAAKTAVSAIGGYFKNMASNILSNMLQVYNIVRGMLIRMAALAAFAGVVLGLKFIISSAATIERQRAQLTALTKSYQEAGSMIAWVRQQALKTPFEVPGLIEMVAQLKSVGLPIKEWFTNLGDLAVQGGRDLAEGLQMATLALVRLKTGATGEAMEQLRRLKISMEDFKKYGVEFNKGGEVTSSKAEAIVALGKIIKEKFGGSMKAMENTASVVFSNIVDMVRDVALMIAGIGEGGDVIPGGFFQKLRDATASILTWFQAHKKEVQAWGAAVGTTLGKAVDWLVRNKNTMIEWAKVCKQAFIDIVTGMNEFAGGLLGIKITAKGVEGVLNALVVVLKVASHWWDEHGKYIGRVVRFIILLWAMTKLIPIFFAVGKAVLELARAFQILAVASATAAAIAAPPTWPALLAILLAATAAYIAIDIAAGSAAESIKKAQDEVDKAIKAAGGPPTMPTEPPPFTEDTTGKGEIKTLEEKITLFEKLVREAEEFRNILQGITGLYETGGASIEKQIDSYRDLLEYENLVAAGLRAKYAESEAGEEGQYVFYKALIEQGQKLLEIRAKLRDLELAPAQAAADVAGTAVDYQELVGSYDDIKRAVNQQILAQLELIAQLQDTQRQVEEGSQAWNDYRKAIDAALTTIAGLQTRIGDLRLKPFESEVDIADLRARFAGAFGSDAEAKAAIKAQVTAVWNLIGQLQMAQQEVEVGSQAWNDYTIAIMRTNQILGDLKESLKNIPMREIDAKIGAAKAHMEMVKASGVGLGAIRAETYIIINLEKERLRLLEAQVAAAEKMGQWIKADELRAKIYGVKKDILDMQKALRGNLEDEFNKMAQQLINAPQELTKILARSGVTLWQKQMEAIAMWSTVPSPGNYAGLAPRAIALPANQVGNTTVNVYIDGEKLDAKVETYVDRRLRQYAQ